MTRDADDLDGEITQWKLERVVAALAEGDSLSAPESERSVVLGRAAASPRRLAEPVSPVELYAGRVDSLREMLATIDGDEWSRPVGPYDWSVHGLVAHLLVIERYTADRFTTGSPRRGPLGDETDEHLSIGAAVIADELARAPRATVERWSRAAQDIVDHARSVRFERDAPVALHGWPFSQWSALIARGFELWTHEDDICAAAGRAARRPSAGELRTMASFSVSTLPFVLATPGRGGSMAPTRVVLTGDGGGTFDIGGAGERRALLVTDVVDYCKVVARRLDPADLDATIEGDAQLVARLLDASRAVAV